MQEEIDFSSWPLVRRFAFSWPCCPAHQQCVWRDSQWCSALAGHPGHEDPQQVYRLDSIPVPTCLWPSQTALTSEQASYSLGFLLSLACSHQPGPPASQGVTSSSLPGTDTMDFWLTVLFKQAGSQHPDFLCIPGPCQPQPAVPHAFPSRPGVVGPLCLGTSVNFSAPQWAGTIVSPRSGPWPWEGPHPPYEFVHPWTFSLSPDTL